jgi:hypothetical protein
MKRPSQVLPFTLTEIFVLLFFALALALVWQSTARADAEDEAKAAKEAIEVVEASLGPAGVQELARLVRSIRDTIPEDFTELIRTIQRQSETRQALVARLIADGADSIFADTASTAILVDSLMARLDTEQDRADALKEALARATQDPEALATCLSKVHDAQRELDNAIGQTEACYRTHGRGLVHPPCWADRNGQIEYAFTAVMSTNSVTLIRLWPEYRNPDAERIPGMVQAAGENLSYAELSNRALPIYEWSTRQNPECRHFVRIVDRVEGKDAFKRNLLTVERFFYKLLVD